MPRNDGHNPEKSRRHHKAMKSGRPGKGRDKKRRAAKRALPARRS
jgi:hypothetical protein